MPFVTTLAAENDDSHWPCGNDSGIFGIGESGTPLLFGATVGAGALVLSASATDTDLHYGIGVATGGPLGWLDHRNEYCDGDPDSFLRVPEDDWLGEEPFQVRAGMHGEPPFTWTVEGVAVANWGRNEGTTSLLGGIDPELANSIAIAQAEYYWEDEDGDVKQEWMFEPRWRARLRRTSLAGMGGPLGALVNVIATVLDPVMIH